MDNLFRKKRAPNRASQASVLSVDTGSILEDTSVQFERLPTSHTARPPPIPYSSSTQSTTYAESSNERLSRALGNFPPTSPPPAAASSFTGHASISPPVNLIATLIPPDDPSDDRERDRDRDRDRERDRERDPRKSRPGSPSDRSIRSVASGSTEQHRRRVDSSAEHLDDAGRRSAASARSSNGNGNGADSLIESRKPLPPSPQKKYATSGRTNSAGDSASINSSSTNRHPPSFMSQSSYNSPYATPQSTSSSRSDNRSLHTLSTASSANLRRGSVVSTMTRSGVSIYGDGPAPALPTPSPYSADFDYTRPSSPTTINLLFEELIPTLASTPKAFDDMRALDVDKKWIMLHNAAFSKWKVAREKLTHRAVEARSAPAVGQSASERGHHDHHHHLTRAPERTPNKTTAKNENPEWYIGRFMDGTVTAANVASLSVCLRTYELAWLQTFIELKGQAVLGNALNKYNNPDSVRRFSKAHAETMEFELLKCLRTLFNHPAGTVDALENNASMSAIAASLASPEIPTRKHAAELLAFFVSRDPQTGANLVLKGIEDLSKARGMPGRFDVWFKYWEDAIDGRGKMGSAVGASDAVLSLRGSSAREAAMREANPVSIQAITANMTSLDSSIGEYGFTNMLLTISLVRNGDLNVRHVLRAQMESSGLRRILDKYAVLAHPHLARYTELFYEEAQNDETEIADGMKEDVVMNFTDPRGTFDAILANTEGRALDFLTSTVKQLLLIPHEAEGRMRYFQLVDRVVTSIVTDRKGLDGDFSSLLGSSVASIAAQFADQDRLEDALEDAADARATIARLRRERETLQEEIAEKDGDMTGQLKHRVTELERNLTTSRAVGEALKSELANTERAYKNRIAALELQVRELFNMLKEAKTLEAIRDDSGVLDRRELMDMMEKKIQRTKAIQRLEGGSVSMAGSNLEVQPDVDRSPPRGSSPRKSRFEDAPDEEVRKHIAESLATGAGILDMPRQQRPPSPQSSRTPVRVQTSPPSAAWQSAEHEHDIDTTPQASRRYMSPPVAPAGTTPTRRSPSNGTVGLLRQPTLAEEIREKASQLGTSPHHHRRRASMERNFPMPLPSQEEREGRTDSGGSASTAETTASTVPTSIASNAEYAQQSPLTIPYIDGYSSGPDSPALDEQGDADAVTSSPSFRKSNPIRLSPASSPASSPLLLPPLSFESSTTSEESSTSVTPTELNSVPRGAFHKALLDSLESSPDPNSTSPYSTPTSTPPTTFSFPPSNSPPTSFPAAHLVPTSVPIFTPSPVPSTLPSPFGTPVAPPPPPMRMPGALPGSSPFGTPGRPMLGGLGGLNFAGGLSALKKVNVGGPMPTRTVGPGGPRAPPPPGPPPGPSPGGSWSAPRKTALDVAQRQMKQLQWDKLPPNSVASTVWGRGTMDESLWSKKLRQQGIFDEMEEDFRVKQFLKRDIRHDAAKLKSILSDNQRKHIEIALLKPGGVNKAGTPEDIGISIRALIGKILALDDSLSETYLGALKAGLPGPEEVGKLNVYKEAQESELHELDPADRFLVELIKIFRDAKKIYDAAKSLLNAPHFTELLKLILLLGNYMNAAGHKGGAFGFKVTSINKLVDTKSAQSSNQTLLHFTAKTVTRTMPETEGFLDELSKAAEAYKADIGHVRAKLADLRASQSALELELENYADAPDLDTRDQFPKKMFRFAKSARERLDALTDDFTLAQAAVDDALAFYGEDVKSIPTTQEFFGIFKTFVTSYKKARDDNAQAAARAAKSAEQARRKAEATAAAALAGPSHSLVDEALRKLKEEAISPKPARRDRDRRRNQPGSGTPRSTGRPMSPGAENGVDGGTETPGSGTTSTDISQNAELLLARLRDEGFNSSSTPPTPTPTGGAGSSRRSRTREGRRGAESRPASPETSMHVPPVPQIRMIDSNAEPGTPPPEHDNHDDATVAL
ncbi:hypothetical protein RQP46_008422 [Phenoliferia psychrophenolica]